MDKNEYNKPNETVIHDMNNTTGDDKRQPTNILNSHCSNGQTQDKDEEKKNKEKKDVKNPTPYINHETINNSTSQSIHTMKPGTEVH